MERDFDIQGYMTKGVERIVSDALRATACSALSVGGSHTESGHRISLRNLEWNLGSTSQMTQIHSVAHMKKGDRSLTSISMLGILDMITSVNDDGVMIGILDVGTVNHMEFVYEGKKCYTYEIRYALEQFDNAYNIRIQLAWLTKLKADDDQVIHIIEQVIQIIIIFLI